MSVKKLFLAVVAFLTCVGALRISPASNSSEIEAVRCSKGASETSFLQRTRRRRRRLGGCRRSVTKIKPADRNFIIFLYSAVAFVFLYNYFWPRK